MEVQLKGCLEVPKLGWESLIYLVGKEQLVISEGNPHKWETLNSVAQGYLYQNHRQRSGVLPFGCCCFLLLSMRLCVQTVSIVEGQSSSTTSSKGEGF